MRFMWLQLNFPLKAGQGRLRVTDNAYGPSGWAHFAYHQIVQSCDPCFPQPQLYASKIPFEQVSLYQPLMNEGALGCLVRSHPDVNTT